MSHTPRDHRHQAACATPRDRLQYVEERDPRTGTVVNRYVQGRLLGKGGFAKCYEATNCATNEVFALKVIDKKSLTKPKTQQKLKSEIKIHSSLRHKHIVGFKRFFEDSNYVYILLELCEGQTLMESSKRKRRFTEAEASYLLWQMLLALRYMHRLGVIHRDLKLGNVMLTDKQEVKIGDFGLAARLDFEGERKRTICGTPNYIAPEILEGSQRGHSFEVDVWTIGVIMYTLLVGHPPFETSDVKATYRRIRAVSYSFPPDLHLSVESRDLIHRILQATPESRPSLEQLEQDRWFRAVPPMQLAPLTLFVPNSSAFHAQQLRIQQAQQRGDAYYNDEWSRQPSRRHTTAPSADDRRAGSAPRDDVLRDRAPLRHADARYNTGTRASSANGAKYQQQQARPRSSSQQRSDAAAPIEKENRTPAAEFEALHRHGASPCIVGGGPRDALLRHRDAPGGSQPRSSPRQSPQMYLSPAGQPPQGIGLAPPTLSASPRAMYGEAPQAPTLGAHVHRTPSQSPLLTPQQQQQRVYSHSPSARRAADPLLTSPATGVAVGSAQPLTTAPATVPTTAPSIGHSASASERTGAAGSGARAYHRDAPLSGDRVGSEQHRDAAAAPPPIPLPPPSVPAASPDGTPRGGAYTAAVPSQQPAAVLQAPTPPGRLQPHGPAAALRTASAPAAQTRESSAERYAPAAAAHLTPRPAHTEQRHRDVSPQQPDAMAPTSADQPAGGEVDQEDNQNLTHAVHAIEQTFHGDAADVAEAPPPAAARGPSLWVTDYVDFTAKYGLAYRLSNGQIGVHYNDSTKMVWDGDSGNIEYVARSKRAGADGQVAVSDDVQRVTVEDFPTTLNKKVTLIKYFRAYLQKAKGRAPKEGQQEVITCSRASESVASPPESHDMVYVKRWLKTQHATIFRLSNKSVQVCFFDHTEIILSSEARLVTYTDPSGQRSTFSLSSMISHPQQEIARRLKYTKDIICKLINVNH